MLSAKNLLVILGNQLFPVKRLPSKDEHEVFMAEDLGLCTYEKHHKQKLALFLGAMRSYADVLDKAGYTVHYHAFDLNKKPNKTPPYSTKLKDHIEERGYKKVTVFEIEDRDFESTIHASLKRLDVEVETLESPMFVTTREQFKDYLDSTKKPFMAKFYQSQRKRLDVLMDAGKPQGGKWSYDADNRKPLPKKIDLPAEPKAKATIHVKELIPWINEHFADHPGMLDEDNWWLPTTREQSLEWLDTFLAQRFDLFGDYEDAISTRGTVLFHSVLSVPLNMGFITPQETIDRCVQFAEDQQIPLNSVEGFVRQVIGWREFIRGIDRNYGEEQHEKNFFGHERKLADCWYDGTTGIPPLDHTVQTLNNYGWCHHIERLMVLGNLMLLCEIHPREAYRYFMEMFVDSSDWVMGPNVYGMALFSDGGIFATKPYISGSNYLVKMSDTPKGDWCDIVDGLYWRFVDQKRDFLKGNPRLNMMLGTLNKMKSERKEKIFSAAEDFIERVTTK